MHCCQHCLCKGLIIINNIKNLITYIALVYVFLSKALYRYNEFKNYAVKYVQKLVIINENKEEKHI